MPRSPLLQGGGGWVAPNSIYLVFPINEKWNQEWISRGHPPSPIPFSRGWGCAKQRAANFKPGKVTWEVSTSNPLCSIGIRAIGRGGEVLIEAKSTGLAAKGGLDIHIYIYIYISLSPLFGWRCDPT